MSGKRDRPYGGKLSALDTLFGDAPEAAAELVPTEQVRVRAGQPRRYFGEAEMRTLFASVGERGRPGPGAGGGAGDERGAGR